MTALLTGLAAAALAPNCLADTPEELSDLVGARGAGGETQMEARGYRLVRNTLVRDQSWTFWWHEARKQCVAISTMDGRYASIQGIPAANCRPGGGGDQAPVSPPADVLTLVCFGTGQHAAFSAHTGYEWNYKSKRYEPVSRTETTNESFSSSVQVDIRGGSGRIHLTGKMVPPMHSGDQDGWWPLDSLRVDSDRITGSYKVNALNRLNLRIDRKTGQIDIDGLPGFSGRCDAGDWGASRRF